MPLRTSLLAVLCLSACLRENVAGPTEALAGINAVGPDDFMQWQAGRQWLSHDMFTCDKKLRIYCISLI